MIFIRLSTKSDFIQNHFIAGGHAQVSFVPDKNMLDPLGVLHFNLPFVSRNKSVFSKQALLWGKTPLGLGDILNNPDWLRRLCGHYRDLY